MHIFISDWFYRASLFFTIFEYSIILLFFKTFFAVPNFHLFVLRCSQNAKTFRIIFALRRTAKNRSLRCCHSWCCFHNVLVAKNCFFFLFIPVWFSILLVEYRFVWRSRGEKRVWSIDFSPWTIRDKSNNVWDARVIAAIMQRRNILKNS